MVDLYEEVCKIICENCGDVFEKPDSCEECMDDDGINVLREYEMKVAEGKIEDKLSLYELNKCCYLICK